MPPLADLIETYDIAEIGRILNALAHEDALKIFIAAKVGITVPTRTIKELGLTQKRYYTRLRELMNVGLIERRVSVYRLTIMGTVIFSLGDSMNTALSQRDRLDLADKVRKAKSISLEETKEILHAISKKGILGSLGLDDLIQPVKMVETYEMLVSELIDRIAKAEQEIYLASYYSDSRVVEAILKASQRGIRLSVLSDTQKSIGERLQVLRLMLNPKMFKLYTTFLDDQVRLKQAEFPFSFCIIDGSFIIIELPNPMTNEFYLGFSTQSAALGQRLIASFEELYTRGKTHTILNQFKKTHRLLRNSITEVEKDHSERPAQYL